eukprot:PLAT11034.1.p1 GENE.PLAT11034.1~~PLAT11034.1.p1  ORF type:complete len:414 (-),score=222.85 PLAT11034.1:194-1435(-)
MVRGVALAVLCMLAVASGAAALKLRGGALDVDMALLESSETLSALGPALESNTPADQIVSLLRNAITQIKANKAYSQGIFKRLKGEVLSDVGEDTGDNSLLKARIAKHEKAIHDAEAKLEAAQKTIKQAKGEIVDGDTLAGMQKALAQLKEAFAKRSKQREKNHEDFQAKIKDLSQLQEVIKTILNIVTDHHEGEGAAAELLQLAETNEGAAHVMAAASLIEMKDGRATALAALRTGDVGDTVDGLLNKWQEYVTKEAQSLEAANSEAEANYAKDKLHYEGRISKLQAKVDGAEEKNAALRKKIADAETDIEVAKDVIARQKAALEAANNDSSLLTERQRTVRQRIQQLEKDFEHARKAQDEELELAEGILALVEEKLARLRELLEARQAFVAPTGATGAGGDGDDGDADLFE